MGWFSKLLSGSTGGLVDKVAGAIDDLHLSGEEKQKFKLEFEALLQKRDSEIEQTMRAEMQAKERTLVAELTQGDNYTKRARPTVVYAGLAFIFFNYIVVPVIARVNGADYKPLDLPPEFWYGWSGIVATWSIGRSFEKSNASNKFSRAVTGSNRISSLLDDDDVAKG